MHALHKIMFAPKGCYRILTSWIRNGKRVFEVLDDIQIYMRSRDILPIFHNRSDVKEICTSILMRPDQFQNAFIGVYNEEAMCLFGLQVDYPLKKYDFSVSIIPEGKIRLFATSLHPHENYNCFVGDFDTDLIAKEWAKRLIALDFLGYSLRAYRKGQSAAIFLCHLEEDNKTIMFMDSDNNITRY